jgi:DHA2 family multidrug resistance protein
VAGLINFVRNIGGSILIAITGAQVTSRALWHESHLQTAMNPGSLTYQQQLQTLTGFFSGSFGSANGAGMALASIYNRLNAQAYAQAYQDVYMELSWMAVVMVLLAFLLNKNRPGEGPGASAVH